MVDTSTPARGSAQRQAALWGRQPRDWADLVEPSMSPLFDEVLQKLNVGPGVSLLDVGCGSGLAVAMAVERGARASGLDATPELLAIARERAPGADFQQGDMEQLPYSDGRFDVVTGFNSFQYAASPRDALAEARRVTRSGGSVMIATWGASERVDMTAVVRAMGSFMPPPPPGAPGPFALSEDGALEALASQAGLRPYELSTVVVPLELPDPDTALRALLSAGPAAAAIDRGGEESVRAAVAAAIAPFRTASGGYSLSNEYLYLIALA